MSDSCRGLWIVCTGMDLAECGKTRVRKEIVHGSHEHYSIEGVKGAGCRRQGLSVCDGSWRQAAVFRTGEEEIAEFFLRSEKYPSNFDFLGMAAKKVDALEERLEGEMNQIKESVEERMSSMEGQVADLRDMMKKMLEFQTQSAASDAKGPEAKNINSEIHREEEEVEIVDGRRGRPHLEPFQREERGGGYGERQGYGVFVRKYLKSSISYQMLT
ncbi:hypothetical protein M5K25_028051 [Dendrobium thyrsiflorum]|uniref:Uncharacterized protein n=1 Tax=Dendrobium thyrsiflorum TaxID=117978 RepID=A0ABD0TVK1_DENTH